MNEQKLQQFVDKVVADLGGAYGIGLVRMGGALGLYRTLAEKGPLTSAELAWETGLSERYLREWLAYHAVSGYLDYDPERETFELGPERAAVLVDENHPAYMLSAFDAAAGYVGNQAKVQEAFKTGGGVGWGDQTGCLFCAIAGFFRPGYQAYLVDHWLPLLEGVVDKLKRGARVADVGCGHGHSTIVMAKAFPNSEFLGTDFHAESIAEATRHAERHGLRNVRFEVAKSKAFSGADYDLVTCFDCLHDMGDPVGTARYIRRALKPDGAWLVVEPFAEDRLEQNFNPVSRLYYAASTMVCVPTSLDQEVGAALGAQAGERRLREVIVDGGGFRHFRRAAATPVNLILEARP